MALKKKAIKGTGLVQLRSVRSSSDGTTVTETETWTGSYSELKTKQDSVLLKVKGTQLEPTEADQGKLTITREAQLTGEAAQPHEITTEVIWQELRQHISLNPYYDDLSETDKATIIAAARDGNPSPTEGEVTGDETMILKLYNGVKSGQDSWSAGVPLVRRTTAKVGGNIGGGAAWFRENPPITVDGEWEWLKTADERRRVGTSFSQVEEWTAATTWDTDYYPESPP